MKAPDDLLEWYDNLLESYLTWDEIAGCQRSASGPTEHVPSNRTLGGGSERTSTAPKGTQS